MLVLSVQSSNRSELPISFNVAILFSVGAGKVFLQTTHFACWLFTCLSLYFESQLQRILRYIHLNIRFWKPGNIFFFFFWYTNRNNFSRTEWEFGVCILLYFNNCRQNCTSFSGSAFFMSVKLISIQISANLIPSFLKPELAPKMQLLEPWRL